MNFSSVHKTSLFYEVSQTFVSIPFRVFYKNYSVTGIENIPKNEPIILAPNHQNALMDPLAAYYSKNDWQVVFMARSDIFKNPIVAKLLIGLKILPVYRIRDGKEKLKLNEEIFNVAIKVLEHKKQLLIFPEASHTNRRSVKVLKKGIARIAFQAEERNNFNLNIKVVPVGIYYSNYVNFRSKLQVNFGKPINVSDYYDSYKENQQKTMIDFKKKLNEEIIKLAIHIKNTDYYDLYEKLRYIYREQMLINLEFSEHSEKNKFYADKKTIEILDNYYDNDKNDFENINKQVNNYYNDTKKLNIRDWIVNKSLSSTKAFMASIAMILLFPLFLYGVINNMIPYFLPKIAIKNIKDKQFHSTFNFALGLFLFPIFYLIQFTLFSIFLPFIITDILLN